MINAVFNEAVRDKKLIESPCTGIEVPAVVHAADFVLPTAGQLDGLAAEVPARWAASVWLMFGCGLRVGEALAVNVGCRSGDGRTLRVREQVSTTAQLRPLKFRKRGDFRDVPLPRYVSEALDK
ncbi:hypothetical protein J5X84_41495, partial [Streptosporangiaceae bacterium NEAU-GS5]|nr:hypothetical protein [Streptosporangiaceae bacterium NEAU-GS5]